MAGSIVISRKNVWTIGLHWFTPVIERLRAAYPSILGGENAAIFSPMEEGFDFINVENLSQENFMNFVHIVEQQLTQFSNDNSIDKNWQIVLGKSWKNLLDQLRQDPRYKAAGTG